MKKNGLIIVFIVTSLLLISLFVFSIVFVAILNNRMVLKIIQRSEDEVVEYVQTKLMKKYPEIIKIELKDKNPLTHSIKAMGVGGGTVTIEGGYEYNFIIEDKYNNISSATYKDGYMFRLELHDNTLSEDYQNIKDNYEKLEKYAKFIEPYSNSLKVRKKYYKTNFVSNVIIVYELDINYRDLDNSQYKDLASYVDNIEQYCKENDVFDARYVEFSFNDRVLEYSDIRNKISELKAETLYNNKINNEKNW